jgi:hypothetical protein
LNSRRVKRLLGCGESGTVVLKSGERKLSPERKREIGIRNGESREASLSNKSD